MAGKYNITLEQGADYRLNLTLRQTNGRPLNLTGYTGFAQIRRDSSSSVLVDFIVSFDPLRTSGKMSLVIPSSVTLVLDFLQGYYDFYLMSGGLRKRILEGTVFLSKTISRTV